MAGRKPTPADVRFAEKCKPVESGCIEWTGGGTTNGYGLFSAGGRMHTAHRWAYEREHGPKPSDIDICHRCDNRRCVNLSHLFEGTRKDNMEDAVRKGRTSKGKPRLYMQGVNHHQAKMTEEQVLLIRKLAAEGHSIQDIMRYVPATYMIIHRIINRATWTHI